ncbi:streptothricin N-acetyltransferase SatA [Bacillus subtilis]|uniref:streptothricin N-acetyltransferase SatA n=1 Tax=Bacillus TaxID=1386 RepID=UPI0013BC3CDB|nr:streptothricin N-acetyltransferase SatA [Bacillus subtilis]KAF2428551.1 GNAT family N-acetyltransferase [Bacillus subtilis]UYP03422.1 streptothricin N-acetyltransferase SatA [Bacillus subtilis]
MIIKMTKLNMKDFNKPNEPLVVFGRMIPAFENGVWTYTEERFSEPYFKQYEDDEMDVSYIEDEGKVVFLYYVENNCIGRIKIRSNWNGYALIEDIAVAKDYRQKGVGTALLHKAIEWAKENRFCGLMLETQDINVSACRFYAKHHFIIGAVDTMLYSNLPTANEIAIFWYYKF